MAMGADIPTVIRTVCESIIHVHATDTRINTTVTFWADFVYTLSSFRRRCRRPHRASPDPYSTTIAGLPIATQGHRREYGE